MSAKAAGVITNGATQEGQVTRSHHWEEWGLTAEPSPLTCPVPFTKMDEMVLVVGQELLRWIGEVMAKAPGSCRPLPSVKPERVGAAPQPGHPPEADSSWEELLL